jgi:type 1 glutamine amidotransferase
MAGTRVVQSLLEPYKDQIEVTVAKADEPWPEGPALIDKADGIVLQVTQGARWMQMEPERWAALQRFAQRKGGLVALHWSVGAYDAKYIPGQVALVGGSRGGPQRKYKESEYDMQLGERAHPILCGLGDFHIKDELYYHLDLAQPSPSFHPLLTAQIDGNQETVAWALERPDGGRSVGYVGIHFFANWGRIEYRRFVTQAILWSLDLPIPEGGVKADVDPSVLVLPPAPPKKDGEAKPGA